MNYSGIAAADALDALNSADDFKPTIDVDTIALDAMPEAIADARRLLEALEALQVNLAAGGPIEEAVGLKLDVRLSTEALAAVAALVGA